jgi:hypothetical protein
LGSTPDFGRFLYLASGDRTVIIVASDVARNIQERPFDGVHGGDHERRQRAASIELGMKVSVRRSGQNRIGVVTKLQRDYVIVRWTNSDLGETTEYEAHWGDVTPLAGWL